MKIDLMEPCSHTEAGPWGCVSSSSWTRVCMQLGLRVARLLPKACMSTTAYNMHFLRVSLCPTLSVQRALSLSKRHGCLHAKQSNRAGIGQQTRSAPDLTALRSASCFMTPSYAISEPHQRHIII